ncbi:thioredoxin family protein [Maribacter chungangensis]|uniref:Thioredoxin family protein n=1 Tax=Maribacter chungangensis TaxID=1069117 RepID=A0ABW3B820_9FLAO
MKKLFILFVVPLLLSAQVNNDRKTENDWHYNLETAKKLAKKQDKNILLYFTGSDWCAPCKVLKKDLFDTPAFVEASQNYILVYIDMPRNQDLLSSEQLNRNKKVVAEHNRKGVFPLLKVLDPKGKSLDEYSGYAMNGDVQYHLRLLAKYQ